MHLYPLTALEALTFVPLLTFYHSIGFSVLLPFGYFRSRKRGSDVGRENHRATFFAIITAPTPYLVYRFTPLYHLSPGRRTVIPFVFAILPFYHPCRVYHFAIVAPIPRLPFYHITALSALTILYYFTISPPPTPALSFYHFTITPH